MNKELEALKVQIAWWEEQWRQQATRMMVLEAALQRIARREYDEPWDVIDIARAALERTPDTTELADWLANYATCFVREERDARKMLDIVQVLRS